MLMHLKWFPVKHFKIIYTKYLIMSTFSYKRTKQHCNKYNDIIILKFNIIKNKYNKREKPLTLRSFLMIGVRLKLPRFCFIILCSICNPTEPTNNEKRSHACMKLHYLIPSKEEKNDFNIQRKLNYHFCWLHPPKPSETLFSI